MWCGCEDACILSYVVTAFAICRSCTESSMVTQVACRAAQMVMKTTRKSGQRKERNPFSSTVVGNCKDFWGGEQPAWRVPKEGGVGLLRGRKVDWGRVYETPRMMGGGYGRVGGGDEEEGLM